MFFNIISDIFTAVGRVLPAAHNVVFASIFLSTKDFIDSQQMAILSVAVK